MSAPVVVAPTAQPTAQERQLKEALLRKLALASAAVSVPPPQRKLFAREAAGEGAALPQLPIHAAKEQVMQLIANNQICVITGDTVRFLSAFAAADADR